MSILDLWTNNSETTKSNEKIIHGNLDNKEESIALGILKMIDKQIPNITIDLIHKRDEKNYYIKANDKILNIPINLNELPKFGKILIDLFNNNIQLFGNLSGRMIAENSLMPDGSEEIFIKDGDFQFNKNDIEKIFIFVMISRKIPIEDWTIESSICKGSVNNRCKEALGY